MRLTSIVFIGTSFVVVLSASVQAGQIARGTWSGTGVITYTDASPVTRKAKQALNDLENQLRQLGQTPASRTPFQYDHTFPIQECIPQNQASGWISTEALFQSLNWDCTITRRSDGISSVTLNFVCPTDEAKGEFTVRFPTDSSAVGTMRRTDMGGQTEFETANFTAQSTGRTDACTNQ